jgi:hypothetical protein
MKVVAKKDSCFFFKALNYNKLLKSIPRLWHFEMSFKKKGSHGFEQV